MATQPSAVAPAPDPASPVKGLIDVFINPGALFERLAGMPKWGWILPLAVAVIVAAVVQILLHPYSSRAVLGMITDDTSPQVAQALREAAAKPAVGLSLLWTPIGIHLIAGDFNEAIGLFALFVGWRHYRRWWATRKTIYGLYTGLWLGLAFYTSPLGLGLALVAGAILPLIFPHEADYDDLGRGDHLEIPDIRKILEKNGRVIVRNRSKGKSFPVSYELSERQKRVLLAGGALNLRS